MKWGWMRSGGIRLMALVVGLAAVPSAEAQYFAFGKNKVQYEAQTWYFLHSRHFDIYYYEGGEHLAAFTAKAAEAAYEQVSHLFQHQIAKPIPLLVYQSHNDFAVTNAIDLPTYAEGIGGVTELFKNRVAIPFTGDYRDFRRVIHHELVHAIVNDMFYGGSIQSIIQNNIQLQIPLWFNEGLAEYAALGWDTQSDMYVREAVLEDNLAPIPYLNGYFAYRGGQGVWDYIAEPYGQEKVSEILQRLRLTRNVDAAFRRATGLSLEELSERWQQALKEIYFPEVTARENLEAIARPLITREQGFYYNASPALSPQGDRLAFITTKGGLFDLYLASANDGKILRRLVAGQTSAEFESLKILSPGLAWRPDGQVLAFAVKSGASDAIALIDVETAATRMYRVPDLDQIISLTWNPVRNEIAFAGTRDAQGDVFVLDLDTEQTVNLTDDLFSDHEPAWSPDGATLVFHSDRGDYLDLGQQQEGGDFRMAEHDYRQYDLYRLTPGQPRLERLTSDPVWDEAHARFGSDPNRLLFISDRNGIPNLYEKTLDTGTERPLTDLGIGVTQVSVSADGQKAAVVALKEGTPSIYLLKTPFERRLERAVLVPNVWAQRVMQQVPIPAPALALAHPTLRQSNPFLRDATDGTQFARTREAPSGLLAALPPFDPALLGAGLPEGTAFASTNGTNGTNGHTEGMGTNGTNGHAGADTTAFDASQIDFRTYRFGAAFDEAAAQHEASATPRFREQDDLNPDGTYKSKRYKLIFSPDLVYGTAGYDVLYGVQGVTQMMFSDMLGNHRIVVATNLLIDLRNSDYILSYDYLPRQTDWSVSGFHISRLLGDFRGLSPTYYRYRQYGASLSASHPFDKFRRIDYTLSVVGVSQADITDASVPPLTRTLLHPSITFTRDVTTPGYLYPTNGHRVALSIGGSPLSFDRQQVRFLTLLTDARAYSSFGGGWYTLAVRGSAGASFGSHPQRFYTSGVQNWINRHFDEENGFPLANVTDFVFATPILPTRGYDINTRNGSYFGLVNAEFRFPIVAALLPGPLPLLPLYNLQGTAFTDVGTIWGGRGLDNPLTVFRRNDQGQRVFDDVLVGAGFGLRTILLGYPLRIDYAWPFDGRHFGDRRIYVSLGLDF